MPGSARPEECGQALAVGCGLPVPIGKARRDKGDVEREGEILASVFRQGDDQNPEIHEIVKRTARERSEQAG